MAYSNFYADGTVTVSAGGTALIGTGTAWVTAGVVPGAAVFVAGHSRPLLVRSVTSETAIVLDMPAPQAASGAAYVMLTLAYDAPMVDLLRRLLNQQTKAFDLDGEDKSLTLTTDAGTVETVYATETSGEGRFRFGLIDGDLDTFRVQRWASGAWVDVFTVARATGVVTWDGSPEVEATYLEGLVASAEAAETAAAASAVAADTSAAAASASAASSSGSVSTATTQASIASTAATTATTQASAAAMSASAAAMDRALVQSAVAGIGGVSVPSMPHLLDGLPPAALFAAPSGAMMLDGDYVADTALFTVSSGAKWVMGPSGLLVQSPANTPAYDWSSGRPRLMIEAAPATNYLGWGQSPGSTGWTLRGAATAVTGQVDPIGGSTAVRLSVSLFSSADVYQIVSGGGASTRHEPSFFIKRVSKSGKLNVYSPGVVGNWEIDLALIPDEWVRITRNHPSVRITQEFTTTASNTIGLLFYAGAGTLAFDVWGAQIEKGERSTSLILTNSAVAVPRISDDVRPSSAVAALMAAAGGCTIALRGSAPGVAAGQIILGTDSGRYFMLANSSTVLVAWLGGNSTVAYAPSGTFETGFGACVGISPGKVSAAINGSATASQTVTPTTPSAVRFGAAPTGSWAVPQLMIDELVIWPFAGSNAGVQAQARVYA